MDVMHVLFWSAWAIALVLMALEVTRQWRQAMTRRYVQWQLGQQRAWAIVRYFGNSPWAGVGTTLTNLPDFLLTGLPDSLRRPMAEIEADAKPTPEQLQTVFENISLAHDRGALTTGQMNELINILLDAGFVRPKFPASAREYGSRTEESRRSQPPSD